MCCTFVKTKKAKQSPGIPSTPLINLENLARTGRHYHQKHIYHKLRNEVKIEKRKEELVSSPSSPWRGTVRRKQSQLFFVLVSEAWLKKKKKSFVRGFKALLCYRGEGSTVHACLRAKTSHIWVKLWLVSCCWCSSVTTANRTETRVLIIDAIHVAVPWLVPTRVRGSRSLQRCTSRSVSGIEHLMTHYWSIWASVGVPTRLIWQPLLFMLLLTISRRCDKHSLHYWF